MVSLISLGFIGAPVSDSDVFVRDVSATFDAHCRGTTGAEPSRDARRRLFLPRAMVSISIFNILGRFVRVLYSDGGGVGCGWMKDEMKI